MYYYTYIQCQVTASVAPLFMVSEAFSISPPAIRSMAMSTGGYNIRHILHTHARQFFTTAINR